MYCSHTDHKHVKNQSTKTTFTQHIIVILMYYFICLETVSKDKSAYFNTLRRQLGSLILKVKRAAESTGIDVDELKELLIFSSTSDVKEIQEAENLLKVFGIVRNKLCSPDNIEILKAIVDHFNLSDVLTAIHEYEEVNSITYMLCIYLIT